jgi:aminopeptidase-like protein
MKYGFYLDMVGNGKPLGFSRSYQGNSYVDHITRNILKHNLGEHWEKPYRQAWGNDEMFYDGPDFQIPTIGLARDYFENYHTDKDDLENCNFAQLEESLAILKQIIDVFETDFVPKRRYQGPLYLSRHKLYIDPKKDPKGSQSIQEIQILMDGSRSCLQIAAQLDIDYKFIRSFVEELCSKELVASSDLDT